MQTHWTITQLQKLLNSDLESCHTPHERLMVQSLCGKEIREAAIAFAQTRKLTPVEIAIASQYGYRAPPLQPKES